MNFLVHHFLKTSIRKNPLKDALVQGDERLSYAELDELSNRLANGLLNAGLQRGDRVGIFLDKSVNQVLSILSISKASGVFVPINHLLFPDQVGHILNDCKIKGLITSGVKLELLHKVLSQTPSLEFVIVTDDKVTTEISLPTLNLNKILISESINPPPDICISNDIASILYTSGSTGRPKGVVLSHANLINGSRIISDYLKISNEERILSILPFSFDYGLNQLLTSLQQGGTLILLSFKFPDEVVQSLIKERITGLAGVPPFWSVLAQPSSSLHRHQYPHLRYITNSGGAVPLKILESLQNALPTTKVFLMYGLTEAFRSTYLPPEELDRRPTSMGKAIPDTQIFVVNDKGKLCKPGEVGELVHRGPTVSLGYWGQPETTNKVLRQNPFLPPELQHTEKICYSGDLVKMDEEGFLYFVGRNDATIKSSGYRISPNEIEEVFYATGNIREAAAIGIQDEVLGQYIKVFIVPHDGKKVQKDELVTLCAHKMPKYMIPRDIEIINNLPKTGNGKIDYQSLRCREEKVDSFPKNQKNA